MNKTPKNFKTPKGTELPIMDIKGQDYLQPAYRLIWFREEHIDWLIETSYPLFDAKGILAKAIIKDEKGNTRATAHRYEKSPDDAEKAETGAIGRALGFLGYGTQFALELQDGDTGDKGKLADAPIGKPHHGDFAFEYDEMVFKGFSSAKKYAGKRIKEIPRPHLEKIFRYAMDNEILPAFCDAAEAYLAEVQP
jgi:hypothetical protein